MRQGKASECIVRINASSGEVLQALDPAQDPNPNPNPNPNRNRNPNLTLTLTLTLTLAPTLTLTSRGARLDRHARAARQAGKPMPMTDL